VSRDDDITRIISMRKANRYEQKSVIESDLARLDRMKDSDIDYSDIPRLGDEFFQKATVAWPPAKRQLAIRLDADVLQWLKAHSKRYQTRLNRILRAAMEASSPAAARGPHHQHGRESGNASHYHQENP
jgi:uncharacterized protein (DUF4415 family)